jgi:hypothetical protein
MDGDVTHDDVLKWLPRDIAESLTMALPPEQRGWYTREEAERDGGRFVEVQNLSEAKPRLLRTGD